MNDTVTQITKKLLEFDVITLITHIRPDGDTLGSAFALFHALKKLGKNVQVVCESEISPRYRFLSDGAENICNDCNGHIVCVDIASPELAGKKYLDKAKNADIVIDHHPTNSKFGKLNLICEDAAACGEIVYDIIEEMGVIDKTIAECIYTAISTDTGCFVYPCTTAYSHKIAAKLIDVGIDTAKLNKLLFRTKTVAAFEIERRALETLEYFYDNTIACMVIKCSWLKELDANEDDIEGLSSIPVQISGVIASATFREISENKYKLSVRTNGKIDASLVCKSFGGGGHKMAAGCTMIGNYDDLKHTMADKLNEFKQ